MTTQMLCVYMSLAKRGFKIR